MSELRKDHTTKERIIIPTKRAKRSHGFIAIKKKEELSSFMPSCHFCRANSVVREKHKNIIYFVFTGGTQ
ncbi:MAG: hypothetical protein HYW01_05320 [Deltaproteobacteria bacterium]|nr:hypothetical protein [Deltaproteobacteria bacterium]